MCSPNDSNYLSTRHTQVPSRHHSPSDTVRVSRYDLHMAPTYMDR